MKISKGLLITQIVLMYIAQIPFYLFVLGFYTFIFDDALFILFLVGFISTVVILPICVVNAIFGIISIFKGNYNPLKMTMITKLALMPWFCFNFFICLLVIAGMLNPWLFIGIPIIAAILMCVTYVFMISTSIYAIAFIIRCYYKRKIKVSFINIFSMILLIIFTLDVVASIILFVKYNEISLTN